MEQQEEWRAVVGFPDYQVSDQGRVASLKGKQVKILRPYPNGRPGQPYLSVTLRSDGRRQIRTVHSLVAKAFLGPRPEGLEVRHLDGDSSNNALLNLRYGTKADNMQDRLAHGRHPMASKTHCKRNHEFTPQNTRLYRGSRVCRACKNYRESASLRALASAA